MIRIAVREDAAKIAFIKKEGWKFGYGGLIADEIINSMTCESNEKEMLSQINGEDDSLTCTITVYQENSEVKAYAYYGKSIDGKDKNLGEIAALYVLPIYHHKGIGKILVDFIKKELKKQGFSKMIIWCLQDNIPAINFYFLGNFQPRVK